MKISNLPFGNCMKHGLKLYVGSIKQQLTEKGNFEEIVFPGLITDWKDYPTCTIFSAHI